MNRSMRMHRAARASWPAALLALATSACGNLTAGGFGEVSVGVAGDRDETSPAPASRPAAAVLAAPASSPQPTSHQLEGEIEVEFLLYLVSEAGTPLQLGDGELEIEVELSGESELDAIEQQRVPSGLYPELHIVFHEIEAHVRGLVVDGIPIPLVDVDIDGALEVTRTIDLDVLDGSSIRLVVDLNALTWIDAVDPVTLTVDPQLVAALIDVVVE